MVDYAQRTVRINDVPFAESAYLYLLANDASQHGIDLRIEPVPWSHVGSALRNGAIHVAFHNTSLVTQLRDGGGLSWRSFFASDPILTYDHYYLFGNRAWVKECDQDQEVNGSTLDGVDRARRLAKSGAVAVEKRSDLENVFDAVVGGELKKHVGSADRGLSAVVSGTIQMSVGGGIQRMYALSEFARVVEEIACLSWGNAAPLSVEPGLPGWLSECPRTTCRFWVVGGGDGGDELERQKLLLELAQAWRRTTAEWSRLKSSDLDCDTDMQNRITAFVNKAPQLSFAGTFNELVTVLDAHDDMKKPGVLQADIHKAALDAWLTNQRR